MSTYPTSQYYVPSTLTVYYSYQQLRYAFPAYSLPKNKDIPELGIYQLWHTEPPEVPEGYYMIQGAPEFHEDDEHWYQTWELIEYPEEPTQE